MSSAFRDDPAPNGETSRILVWDAPVRAVHWLIVLCFTGAWLTADSEQWRLVHVTLGYSLAGLVVFRLLWGVIGTRHARFSSFVRGPHAVSRYLLSLIKGRPEHHTGHNPAGALAIVALLVLALVVAVSGWATYFYIGGDGAEDLHESAANTMLALVAIHIIAVIASSWLHRQNLVAAMISGRKRGRSDESIVGARGGIALLMLVVVLGFWWLEWRGAPSGLDLSPPAVTATAVSRDRESDDD